MEQLAARGQSVWLDYIRRDMLQNGDMAAMVADGLRGMTSNPSIFEKAIAGSDQYDDDIARFVSANGSASPIEIFEHLAIEDIKSAADMLAPVYERTDGADGFVSLEVSPHLADDTDGTIAEARRLWAAVGRPNLMIKVPATAAGIPAIETLIGENINVNVTLMFSMGDYEAVSHAYLRGIEKAADPSRVASVASFFVSRVDTAVDNQLAELGEVGAPLLGKVAIANAKVTYQRYLELFGDDFEAEWGKGAFPQRLLWASTGTKNPAYSDLMYVEGLIGDNTVNTLPPATLDAFAEHGSAAKVALVAEVEDAYAVLDKLAAVGVDLDSITDKLQRDGVQAFIDAFEALLGAIEDKRSALV
jgi:transaldolase/glucose-6-phosphate isomerase